MNTRFSRRTALFAAAAILLAACGTSKAPAPTPTAKPKAVVGLALGGGASKGFAHIGVIKVLRQNNIPVDIVTGTSAGAVVGSLYASGMSPDRLELEAEILEKADVVDLTSPPPALSKAKNCKTISTAKSATARFKTCRRNSPPLPPISAAAGRWPSTKATPAKRCALR